MNKNICYQDTLYHDLTQILIGFAFDIFKQIGSRYPETVYQNAYENKLIENNIKFKRENYCKIEVDGKRVGSFKLDFIIENKIIVELKVRNHFFNKDYAQVLTYMRLNKINLGLILLYSTEKVKVKRLIL